jgi:hypothetical protein
MQRQLENGWYLTLDTYVSGLDITTKQHTKGYAVKLFYGQWTRPVCIWTYSDLAQANQTFKG